MADFIGESNLLNGLMIKDFEVEFCNKKFECVDKGFEINEPVDIVIRPEDIKMVNAENSMLKGHVTSVVFKGVHYEMTVVSDDYEFILHNTKSAEVGSTIGLDIYPEDIHIMKKSDKNG